MHVTLCQMGVSRWCFLSQHCNRTIWAVYQQNLFIPPIFMSSGMSHFFSLTLKLTYHLTNVETHSWKRHSLKLKLTIIADALGCFLFLAWSHVFLHLLLIWTWQPFWYWTLNFTSSKERQSPHTAEYKEQKKREKQRLEKEKKEQREREKKENEMKKKFKVSQAVKPLEGWVFLSSLALCYTWQ